MFKAYIAYKRGQGLIFSNLENTFKDLFDLEQLNTLMSAFDRDEVTIHGQVLPEDPIRFVVEWAAIDGEELDLREAVAITKYLKLDFNQETLGGTNDKVSNGTGTAEPKSTEVSSGEDIRG